MEKKAYKNMTLFDAYSRKRFEGGDSIIQIPNLKASFYEDSRFEH